MKLGLSGMKTIAMQHDLRNNGLTLMKAEEYFAKLICDGNLERREDTH